MHLAREVIGLPPTTSAAAGAARHLSRGIVMRKVLGRGLEALIPTGAPADEVAAERGSATTTAPFEVEVDRIMPNPQQPRRTFDDEKLREPWRHRCANTAFCNRCWSRPGRKFRTRGGRKTIARGAHRRLAARSRSRTRCRCTRILEAGTARERAARGSQSGGRSPRISALGRRVRHDAGGNRRPTSARAAARWRTPCACCNFPPTFKPASNPAR